MTRKQIRRVHAAFLQEAHASYAIADFSSQVVEAMYADYVESNESLGVVAQLWQEPIARVRELFVHWFLIEPAPKKTRAAKRKVSTGGVAELADAGSRVHVAPEPSGIDQPAQTVREGSSPSPINLDDPQFAAWRSRRDELLERYLGSETLRSTNWRAIRDARLALEAHDRARESWRGRCTTLVIYDAAFAHWQLSFAQRRQPHLLAA